MSVKIVCDACGNEYAQPGWLVTDQLTVTFPRSAVGDVDEGEDYHESLDVCSWECLYAFATQIIGGGEEVHEHAGRPSFTPEPDLEPVTAEDVQTAVFGQKEGRMTLLRREGEDEGEAQVRIVRDPNRVESDPNKDFDPRGIMLPGMRVDGRGR